MKRFDGVLALLFASGGLAFLMVIAGAFLLRLHDGPGSVAGNPWWEIVVTAVAVAPLVAIVAALVQGLAREAIPSGAVLSAAIVTAAAYVQFQLSPVVPGYGGYPMLDVTRLAHVDSIHLALLLAPVLVAWRWRRRGATREEARAGGAVGVAFVAVVLLLPRLGAPPPSAYLRSLKASVPIEGGRSFEVDGRRYTIETSTTPALDDPWSRAYAIPQSGCFLRGPRGSLPLGNVPERYPCELGWGESESPDIRYLRPAIYLDSTREYAIVYQHEYTGPYRMRTFARLDPRSAPELCGGCGVYALAIRVADGTRVELGPRTIGRQLAPPPIMTGVAVCASLVAIALFCRARRERRRVGEGTFGEHQGGGVVAIGESIVSVAQAERLPKGPVVLFTQGTRAPTVFRDGVVFGSALTRAEAFSRATALELAAFAVAIVAAAPLVGAHLAGI